MKKICLLPILGFLFVGCLAYTQPKIRDKSLELWAPKPNKEVCYSNSYADLNSAQLNDFNRNIYGYSFPEAKDSVATFIRDNNLILNRLIYETLDSKETSKTLTVLHKRLINAAKEDAFTNSVKRANTGSNPNFMKAILVKNIAFVVSALNKNNFLKEADFLTIENWVLKLMQGMSNPYSSIDHDAAICSTEILWGAASNNRQMFDNGIIKLKKLISDYYDNLEIGRGLRNNNEVMHHLILSVHAAKTNGINGYVWKIGNNDLTTAILQHSQRVLENGTKAITTSGDPSDDARSIFKKKGIGTHLAWIPIVLHDNPDDNLQKKVLQLHNKLNEVDSSSYAGLQIGIHTGCYFGLK
jgi:hypothetical protein